MKMIVFQHAKKYDKNENMKRMTKKTKPSSKTCRKFPESYLNVSNVRNMKTSCKKLKRSNSAIDGQTEALIFRDINGSEKSFIKRRQNSKTQKQKYFHKQLT